MIAILIIAVLAALLLGFMVGRQSQAARHQAQLLTESRDRNSLESAAAASRARQESAEAALATRERELAEMRTEQRSLAESRRELATRLETQQQALAEQRALLETAQARLTDTFKALATDSLQANNQQFIELARMQFESLQQGAKGDLERRQQSIAELVAPVRESLDKVMGQIGAIEKDRAGAYGALLTQVESLASGQQELKRETGNLVGALRRPNVRGRWGELQLRRVVELAGMIEHVDFTEQVHMEGEDGALRPDLVVRLPGGKSLVVDAKAPLLAYLESLEATDDATRSAKLADHARQIRDHITKLSGKAYWSQLDTPEFVVLFIPGESFYSAALEQDPSLIEIGINQKVILATPTTLIALLRTVSYGWRQESLADNARRIAALGKDLYERLQKMAEHWARMGKGLSGALLAYNEAVGSLESRLMPAARKFRDLDVGAEGEEIRELAQIETLPRVIQAEDLQLPPPPTGQQGDAH